MNEHIKMAIGLAFCSTTAFNLCMPKAWISTAWRYRTIMIIPKGKVSSRGIVKGSCVYKLLRSIPERRSSPRLEYK